MQISSLETGQDEGAEGLDVPGAEGEGAETYPLVQQLNAVMQKLQRFAAGQGGGGKGGAQLRQQQGGKGGKGGKGGGGDSGTAPITKPTAPVPGGKGGAEKFQGDCHYCGKAGHRIRECRLKTKHVEAGIFKKTALSLEDGAGEEDQGPVWICTFSSGTCTTG